MSNKNVSSFFRKLNQTQPKQKFLNSQVFFYKFSRKETNNLKQIVLKLCSISEKKKFRNFHQLRKFLSKTKYYHLKRDLNTMVHLENYIIYLFKKKNFINNFVKGIEFPINIRIVHPEIPPNFKSKYNTDSIHCDPWAGEPDDLINIVIYIDVPKEGSKLNIFNVDRDQIKKNIKMNSYYKNKFFLNTPKYFNELKKIKKISSLKLKHQNGSCYIFNCFVPHNTNRNGNKVRLSLEFRLRTENPYNKTIHWLNTTNRRGRYWLLPDIKLKNFDHKYKEEISKIKKFKHSKKLIKLRNQEVEKFLV